MIAILSGLLSTNFIAACILGNMDPAAKCPSLIYFLASSTVNSLKPFCSGLLKFIYTFSTAVSIISTSASTISPIFSAAKSLSITAGTPSNTPFPLSITGTPPPPAAITIYPAPTKHLIAFDSTISTI